MTQHNAVIGDYLLSYYDDQNVEIKIGLNQANQNYYGPFPTKEQCNDAFGTTGLELNFENTFLSARNTLLASPKFPEEVYVLGHTPGGCFERCSRLVIPPKLPRVLAQKYNSCGYVFWGCSSLIQPSLIPDGAYDVSFMYRDSGIITPTSIPTGVRYMSAIYRGCTSLEGEFCIKSTTISSYSNALMNTSKPITIYGDRSLCEAVAATANNGNASWSAWYEPETPVTNRGQGSRTTAEDMTRMVRNGALAVPSYAPGRMVYHRGDFVREDEWDALVAAAQTIDPTVTASTRYDNLNKIEAAFGSAL